MKVFTRQWMIDEFPEVWKRNYLAENGVWKELESAIKAGDIYAQLLDFKPQTSEHMFAITGEDWAKRYLFGLNCDNCRQPYDIAVIFDALCDYQESYICQDCIAKAVKLMEE